MMQFAHAASPEPMDCSFLWATFTPEVPGKHRARLSHLRSQGNTERGLQVRRRCLTTVKRRKLLTNKPFTLAPSSSMPSANKPFTLAPSSSMPSANAHLKKDDIANDTEWVWSNFKCYQRCHCISNHTAYTLCPHKKQSQKFFLA